MREKLYIRKSLTKNEGMKTTYCTVYLYSLEVVSDMHAVCLFRNFLIGLEVLH